MRASLGWLALAIAGIASAAPTLPPSPARAPGLNHAYVVLDRATFDAIRNSAPLAALLGASDTGLPAYDPPTAGADRLFLRGRQTYLELFAPKNRFDEPVGKVGIGVGADDAAAFAPIEAGWRRACGTGLTRATIEWTQTQPPVPWYEVLYCKATGEGDALVLWAMLYRPEFHRWQSGGATGAVRTSRRDLLTARAGRFEVTGLTLDVAPALYSRLVRQLVASGFGHRPVGTGARLVGDGWSLTLFPTGARPRLRAIDLAIGGVGVGRLRLGRADLVPLERGTAQLRFR